jgi:DNA polymerase-3 subunit alpha
VVKYINECREMGIPVLPPDVNFSDKDFTPAPDGIRFGLGAIKNVGGAAVDSIMEARASGGRFRSIFDFCERVNLSAVNRRMIESFIKAGAMDSLEGNRAQLYAVIDSAMESGQRLQKDRESGQGGLFGDLMGGSEAPPDAPLPELPNWTRQEKLAGEKELLGIYVTGHPLDDFEDKVSELATHYTDTLEDLPRGAEVAICGILTGILRRRNKDGKLWASMQIEDRKGAVEGMAFSTQYEGLLPCLIEDKPMLIRGLVLPEEGAPPKISIQSMVTLENASVNLPSLISIRVPVRADQASGKAAELQQLFTRKPGGAGVRLRLEKSRDFSVILDVATKVRPDKEFKAEVERICGPESVEVLAN